ncbi:hypothetical protein LTR91_004299 [Friedmanniomyces endolithicus]|uniref:Amino acid permease/ SLC12A domain-containing protein n=1 Tax=Friedmanniomyces endolithicus TaxID=329885 RepID=A0AAN6QY37_9PEZI|nr:hypothetical protein LTR57_005405 [Friedmanniomyces endolithicus]KAK1004804.1 hypothetical protein LTR91_004299 [Friedmanniomyces endolithicus]
MSEELKDASLQLPKAMMWAILGNGVMDLDALLSDGSQYPIIQVLFNATSSYAGTIILGSILLVLLFFSTVTTVASASRQTWAFSRDCGFPFSEWIRYVPPAWEIPLNALLVCLGVSLILSAINFGSSTALGAVLSVSTRR